MKKLADEWGSTLLLLYEGSGGILSAFRADIPVEENLARHEELGRDIEALGLSYTESDGEWKGRPELMYRIEDIGLDDLLALGRKYDQEALLYRDGQEWQLRRL